jgi:teichuronic acid biosynthesis protein TuaE
LLKSLGFGVGAGNAEYYMAHYAVYDTRGILNVHNWWVEILVDYGVFIFIGYIILYYKLFVSFFKLYFRLDNGFGRAACETVLLGLAGFLFASISSSSIITLRFHWLFFAFALALLNYFRNKPKETNL